MGCGKVKQTKTTYKRRATRARSGAKRRRRR